MNLLMRAIFSLLLLFTLSIPVISDCVAMAIEESLQIYDAAFLNGFYLSTSAQNGRLSINAHLVNHFTLLLSIMMSDQNYM